ncbi:MAG: hypothetical protein H8F28_16405 [Fibrella sp.]|nr:hypothetical protein [Armatimonadota bacterium]
MSNYLEPTIAAIAHALGITHYLLAIAAMLLTLHVHKQNHMKQAEPTTEE